MRLGLRLLAAAFLLHFCACENGFEPDYALTNDGGDKLIEELLSKVEDMQVKKDSSFVPFVSFIQKRGGWMSDIKLNFMGTPAQSLPRSLNCPDNNAFVPAWITTCLLEAHTYGKVGRKSRESTIEMAMELLQKYEDRNLDKGEGVMVFWPQVFNKTSAVWHPEPDNLMMVFETPKVLNKIPEDVLEKLFSMPGIGKLLKAVHSLVNSGFQQVFQLTPDFDDTFVSIGLGALMKKFPQHFSGEFAKWRGDNANVQKAFEYLKRYAYKPWSTDYDSNLIDGRSFYWLRDFLYQIESSNGFQSNDKSIRGLPSRIHVSKKSMAFPTTWVSNHTMNRDFTPKGVSMPLHVQNIDMTVASNVLSGLTLSILADPATDLDQKTLEDRICEDPAAATDPSALPAWFDAEMQDMYVSTAELMAWSLKDVNSAVFDRRDISLLYYPSVYNFLWMASRTYLQLNSLVASKCGLPPALLHAHGVLKVVFEGTATKWLMANLQTEVEKKAFRKPVTFAFWDDFLGNGDKHHDETDNERHQDRLFSSSQALNILLNVYVTHDKKTDTLTLLDGTPKAVRQALKRGVAFLRAHSAPNALSVLRKYAPLNAFFSGSFKGPSSFSFVYPTNFARFLNGTFFETPHDGDMGQRGGWKYGGATFGVSGVIPPADYDAMLEQTWFGSKVPREFKGFNHPENRGFPFWSSPAFTYATALLALSKYRHVEGVVERSLGGVHDVVFE